MLEYAPKGLIGVLTPQANTTVEPEFGILCPPGYALLTARLVSAKPTIEARLVDYIDTIEMTLDRFANAPLNAVAFACTGAAYLEDPDREAKRTREITERRGYPFITAADAVADALTALGARRVGIVSPYGDDLHERCLEYWARRGITITDVARIDSTGPAFHPIYALGAARSREGLEALGQDDLDAVATLGTGLPTLPTIRRHGGEAVPVISPNLCLMWRAVIAIEGAEPSADTLRPWLTAETWGGRLDASGVVTPIG